MLSEKTPAPHRGHRERMRRRINAQGAESLAEYERLEALLYHAITRQDTNPLAHRLIERFGSVDAVLHADRRELLTVHGVGAVTADLLVNVGMIIDLLRTERQIATTDIIYSGEAKRYFRNYFASHPGTECAIILLSSTCELVHTEGLAALPSADDLSALTERNGVQKMMIGVRDEVDPGVVLNRYLLTAAALRTQIADIITGLAESPVSLRELGADCAIIDYRSDISTVI